MKRILLFLATKKGYEVLKHVTRKYRDNIGAVVSFNEIGVQKNWREDIEIFCAENEIDFFLWENVKLSIRELIDEHRITGAICISWRYLIPIDVNDYLEDRIIVFHDSLLPKYRGFAPVVTAMLCGEKAIGATAFFANEEIDAGDIICQKHFCVSSRDYIADVIDKMTDVYIGMADYVIVNMNHHTITSVKQDNDDATYSIWRDEDDYWIDWKWNAERISRHIHALGYPYEGAKTKVDNQTIRITKCNVVKDLFFEIRTPGKIWKIVDNKPIIVCGKGMIRIDEAMDERGMIYMFKTLRSRMGGM